MNSLSPQGQLPLGIALMSRSAAIAQTLVQNGKADVNAYNGEVNYRFHCTNFIYFVFSSIFSNVHHYKAFRMDKKHSRNLLQ